MDIGTQYRSKHRGLVGPRVFDKCVASKVKDEGGGIREGVRPTLVTAVTPA